MAEATWLGDEGAPYSIKQFGVTFERGKAADIGDLTDAQVEKLKGNPQFKLSGDKSDAKPVEPNPDEEAEQLRAHLQANGEVPRANASLASLRTAAAKYPGPAPAVVPSTGVSDAPVQPVGAAKP